MEVKNESQWDPSFSMHALLQKQVPTLATQLSLALQHQLLLFHAW